MKLLKTLLIFFKLKIQETWKFFVVLILSGVFIFMMSRPFILKPLVCANSYSIAFLEWELPDNLLFEQKIKFQDISKNAGQMIEKNQMLEKIKHTGSAWEIFLNFCLMIALLSSLIIFILFITAFYPVVFILIVVILALIYFSIKWLIVFIRNNWEEAKRISKEK